MVVPVGSGSGTGLIGGSGGSFTYGGSTYYGSFGASVVYRAPTISSPTVSPTTVPQITGIDPGELANATYGKVIPIFIGGKARLGGSIVVGPYITTDSNNKLRGSFGISFGFPANPTGTRVAFEIAFNSKVVWQSTAGTATISAGTFLGSTFTARFYQGTFTQSADPIETSNWGANAVAYRPQMMLFFENLLLEDYDNRIPFVALMVGDTTDSAVPSDGINLGEGLERLAYSPWVGMTADTFETVDIDDIADAIICAEDESLVDLLRKFSRAYRAWDVLQTDKLRVKDRGSNVSPDIVLDRSRILNKEVAFHRQEPVSTARELELITIDPDADYVLLPATAKRPKEPYRVSGSAGKESISLPIVIDAATRQALVTYMKFSEEQSRERCVLTTTAYGMQTEPGDLVALSDLHSGLAYRAMKCIEASLGANHTVQLTLEAILRCLIGEDDTSFASVLFLSGFEGVDGATAFVDESSYARTITANDNAQVDTAVFKYGASALLVDGNADRLLVPDSSDWNFDGAFTVECWFLVAAAASNNLDMILVGHVPNSFTLGWALRHLTSATSQSIGFDFSTNGITPAHNVAFAASGLIARDTWYHLAADRDSLGTLRIYLNGVMKAKKINATGTAADVSSEMSIGGAANNFSPHHGSIDEVRVSTGSRYGNTYGDTSFTPPTAAFPRS